MGNKKDKTKGDSRRNFLKSGFILSAGTVVGGSLLGACGGEESGEK